jgi:hypothetical protein
MPGVFLNENVAQNVGNATSAFQVGVTDVDTGAQPEIGLGAPWLFDPEVSFMDRYDWIEVELDSGIVVHRPLPQSAQDFDTLGQGDIYNKDFAGQTDTNGPNFKSNGTYTNLVQRMAASRYRFCLKGWCLRAGYQPCIPTLLEIAGVPAIPDDDPPQKVVGPIIVGNNSGIPIYYAAWALWYTTAVPPVQVQLPPPSLAQHIAADDELPDRIQIPVSTRDQNSTQNKPPPGPIPPIRQGP